MRDATPYRGDDSDASWKLEMEAHYELLGRLTKLRVRVLLPLLGLFLVAGLLGGVAHAFGYWSVFGRLFDGRYYVNKFSLSVAFLMAGAPFATLGGLAYLALSLLIRRRWLDESVRKYGLAPEVLAERSRRL